MSFGFFGNELQGFPAALFEQNNLVLGYHLGRLFVKMANGIQGHVFVIGHLKFFGQGVSQGLKIAKFILYTNRETDG